MRSVSVLTEEDGFGGSLDDLARINRALPGVAVLRKDFLLDEEDVETSWRAGADAVLLIASLLDEGTLVSLHQAAQSRGLAALVEAHDAADVERCRSLAPSSSGSTVGTFRTSARRPHSPWLRPRINWKTRLVLD